MDSGVCDTPLQAIWRDADITLWFQSCSDFPAWQGRNRPPFSFKKRYGKRCLTHADKLSGSMGRTDQRYGKRFHAPKRSRTNAQTGSKREVKQFFGRQKKLYQLAHEIGTAFQQQIVNTAYPIIHLLPGTYEMILAVMKQDTNVANAIHGIALTVGRAKSTLNTVTHSPNQKMCIRYTP